MKRLGKRNGMWLAGVAVGLLLTLTAAAQQTAPGERFDALLDRAQRDPRGMTEADLGSLMQLARDLGRPYPASLAAKQYLSLHAEAASATLAAAADLAVMAGDLRTAVSRYKSALKNADRGPEASRQAARLYGLLVDSLGAEDEAYRLMGEDGERFRDDPAARKFDPWFLEAARQRRDVGAALRRLSLVFGDKQPLEQERLIFWPYLDWVMGEINTASPETLALRPAFEKLAPLIRDDPRRQRQAELLLANLRFQGAIKDAPKEQRGTLFDPVLKSALALFDAAPVVATIRDTLWIVGGGNGGFNAGRVRDEAVGMPAYMARVWSRLDAASQRELVEWLRRTSNLHEHLMRPEQWVELFTTTPPAAPDAAGRLPLASDATTREILVRQAAALKDVPGREAAVIRAVAAAESWEGFVDAAVAQESCLLSSFGETYRLVADDGWRLWSRLNPPREGTPGPTREMVLEYLLRKHLSVSPAALHDPEAVKSCLVAAWWVHSGKGRALLDFVKLLDGLAWVPYEGKTRGDVFGAAFSEFQRWRKNLKREERDDIGLMAQVTSLDEAFRKAMEQKEPQLDRAPNPLCRAAAELAVAQARGAFDEAAARRIFDAVRNYPAQRTPYGAPILGLVARRGKGADPFDAQLSLLATLMEGYRPDSENQAVRQFVSSLIYTRNGWDWWRFPSGDADKIRRLNDVFAKAIARLTAQKQFSAELFDWFRGSRRGNGWGDQDLNKEILAQLIESRLLLKHGYRDSECRAGATTYMKLVRAEFQGLRNQYPEDRYFDDLFCEEAKQTRFLDSRYWEYARDNDKKVAAAAAEILGAFDALPFGYGAAGLPVYERNDFWRWQWAALNAAPAARDALIKTVESRFGRTRFDSLALGYGPLDFATIENDTGRRDFFARLEASLTKAAQVPDRIRTPAFRALAGLVGKAPLTDAEFATLSRAFATVGGGRWNRDQQPEWLVYTVQGAMTASVDRVAQAMPQIADFWRVARDTENGNLLRDLTRQSKQWLDQGREHLAAAYALSGHDLVGGRLSEEDRALLVSVKSRALAGMARVIPVERTDPRYPVFMSQMSFLTGRPEQAWEQYAGQAPQVRRIYKELDPGYSTWLVELHADLGQWDDAEQLARLLILWMDESPRSFDPEVRGQLYLAYANLAYKRQEYPRARAQYERIAATDDFVGTMAQRLAELRIAEVDRLTRNFDAAIQRLEKLIRRQDRFLQMEGAYVLAMVKFDQEDYPAAMSDLERVFALDPNHANGRILEAKLYLKMKKLMEATEVKVGLSASQQIIVPGRPLRVRLEDPNLAVVGRSTEIEIEVWTRSGDRETFSLMPFGDSQTKFEGQLLTRLSPVAPGDGTINVLGDDEIFYDFSKRFKAASRVAGEGEPARLQVATDAELYASSGAILSREEQERQAMERMIRERLAIRDEPVEAVALSAVRAVNQIKPGNRINIRLADPDRSQTPQKDTLNVRVAATSGDTVPMLKLVETDTHSGVFEGVLRTDSAEALAYASNSEEGADPNAVISAGTHRPWVALGDNIRPKLFTVDLYDNVAAGALQIAADVPGRKLKRFLLQTSLNGRDFQTVTRYPDALEAWDGAPRFVVARVGGVQNLSSIEAIRDYLEAGYAIAGENRIIGRPASAALDWGADLGGQAARLNLKPGQTVVIHLSAGFYLDDKQQRTFTIVPADAGLAAAATKAGTRFFLAVDGRVPEAAKTGTPTLTTVLAKGTHRLDVYVVAPQGVKPGFAVHCDTPEPPYMIPCPGAMFDPAAAPQIAQDLAFTPAAIKADAAGALFDVAFNEKTQTRILRLIMLDFETDAPGLRALALTDRAGKKVLPTKQDLLSLRKNDILEIVPGDKVSIAYEDPLVVTKGRENHEVSLVATYNNALLSASFVEVETQGGGAPRERYIPLKRFEPGDAVTVFVRDADCDTSDDMDRIPLTVQTYGKKPIEIQALETDAHSGVFTVRIFPVREAAKRPVDIPVAPGEDITIRYMDRENTDPGIAFERAYVIEQIWYKTPELRVFEVFSMEATGAVAGARQPAAAAPPAPTTAAGALSAAREELFPAVRDMVLRRPVVQTDTGTVSVLISGPLLVEAMFPALAKSPVSQAEIFVQTLPVATNLPTEGASTDGVATGQVVAFDLELPGTIRCLATPSAAGAVAPPPGYRSVVMVTDQRLGSPLDDGRFTFSVPRELGPRPATPMLDTLDSEGKPVPLAIRGEDAIKVGFRYREPNGQTNWIVRHVSLAGDTFLDVMDRNYQEEVVSAYVGDSIFFRLVAPMLDRTEEKDAVRLMLQAGAAAPVAVELQETSKHAGMFKGSVRLTYATNLTAVATEVGSLPVRYGDDIRIRFEPGAGRPVLERQVSVHKGADGNVLAFTKRFKDPEIAVQTQFTLAESYFELAKRHRQMGQDALVRREIAQGKKLLEEVLRDFPESEARVQADYLLANLAFEFAKDAVNADAQREHNLEALNRFAEIVARYPDSPYAPKAQYKKGLVYERMNEMDKASEEYVKLSYRYPDNELVAETIARLGQYFLQKGKDVMTEVEAITEPVAKERRRLEALAVFTTAGQVFGRLGERFPSHKLAARTRVLSGQSFMRAEKYDEAVTAFGLVIAKPEDAEAELVAEAMFWSGESFMKRQGKTDLMEAYKMYKRLTWDYPASKWAKFARGRLASQELSRVDK